MHRLIRSFFLAAFISLFWLASLSPSASALSTVHRTMDESVHGAEAIFVGRVLDSASRWGTEDRRYLLTDYTVEVLDVIHAGPKYARAEHNLRTGGTVTLTYPGGEKDGLRMRPAGLGYPVVGETGVFLLRPQWFNNAEMTPEIYTNQGLYREKKDERTGALRMVDSDGMPLSLGSDRGVKRLRDLTAADRRRLLNGAGGAVTRDQFVSWLRNNVGAIKRRAVRPIDHGQGTDPALVRAMTVPTTVPPSFEEFNQRRVKVGGALPDASVVPSMGLPTPPPGVAPPRPSDDRALDPSPTHSRHYGTFTVWPGYATFEALPNTGLIGGIDQQEMNKWNYYGDIFRVSTSDGWAWRNNVSEVAGFVNSTDYQRNFGQGWGSTTLAICWTLEDNNGWALEADIAINPAYSWSLDDEAAYNGGSAWPVRQSLLHELGHGWGLDHNFNFISVMDYPEQVFRSYSFPYMDDAEALRANYPSKARSRTAFASYFYRSAGTQDWDDASYPTTAVAGGSITVTGHHTENIGTTNLSAPRLWWYLTPLRKWEEATDIGLGERTYGALNRFAWAAANTTLTIPSDAAAGQYYLCTYVPDGHTDTPGESDFPHSTRWAFSRFKVTVQQRLTGLTVSPNPVTRGNSATGTVTMGGPHNGTTVYLSTGNSSASVPSSVYVPAGSLTATFTVTVPSSGTASSTVIQASDNIATLQTTLNITTALQVSSVSVSPTSVNGGENAMGTVFLTQAAPAGGFEVRLTSLQDLFNASSVAQVPPAVIVPAGATSAGFIVGTATVNNAQSASIVASGGGASKAAALTVNPQPTYSISGAITQGGSNVSGTISYSGTVGNGYVATVAPTASIPDNSTTGIESSVSLSAAGSIGSVRVGVDIAHPFQGDLEVTLIHPGGTEIRLHNRSGSGTDNLRVSYPDQISPVASLSSLEGLSASGTWKLRVRDLASGDTGTLDRWTLIVSTRQAVNGSVSSGSTGYSIAGLRAATYTLTPSGGGPYTPTTRSVTVGPSQSGQNFDIGATYSISGTVRFRGSGLSGVTVTAFGPVGRSATTAADGTYTITGLSNGTYTVTPGRTGFTFTPASRSVGVAGSNPTGADFNVETYELAGQVTADGQPLAGVAVTASNAQYTDSDNTGTDGVYSIWLPEGTYTLSASLSPYTFSPSSQSVTIDNAGATRNLTANVWAISGRVTVGTSGLGGVTIAATGAINKSVTTNSDGTYRIGGLVNGSYTLTASRSGYSFSPTRRTPTIASADLAGENFAAASTTVSSWRAGDFSQSGDGSTRILMSNGTSVRVQKWSGTMQLGPSYKPASGWYAAGIAANSAGGSFVLWRNGTTSYQLWAMSGTGALSTALPAQAAGGWVAVDVTAAGDGTARVLLVSGSGQIKVVRFSGSTATTGPTYTPSAGWTAVGIAAGADNKTRLLWRNGTTSYQLWTLTAAGVRETAHPVVAASGWLAREVSQSGDGTTRVLLVSPSGQIRINRLNGGAASLGPIYTPASGYAMIGISADPDTSGRTRMLWQQSSGVLNLWTLAQTGALQSSAGLGTY